MAIAEHGQSSVRAPRVAYRCTDMRGENGPLIGPVTESREETEMGDWVPKDEFQKSEYGQLDQELDPSKYYGRLDQEKLPDGSSVVPDPKDGNFGIIKDDFGNPIGKVKLDP